VGKSIAYAYLPPERAVPGTRGEIDVFGAWVGAEVVREPLWDPAGERIRS
jgi:4-methylaminobutanoate oxidase (formaldehyde-forming)